jgi:Fe-Mn family superoxide dismutase
MAEFTNKDLKENIRSSLKLDDSSEVLDEAYVAQVEHYDLPTEMLSVASKKSHIELYDGYVEKFNRISAELDAVDRSDANSNHSKYRSLKIDEAYNMMAIYLHELYFSNISDLHSKIAMDSLSYMRLSRDFGGFDKWQQDFIACCMSSRCGWAVTVYNTYLQRYMNCTIDLHSTQIPVGSYPIIVMDVWQHAYYRDYLKDVKTYVFAMMKQLNWNVIENRFKKAEKIQRALRS